MMMRKMITALALLGSLAPAALGAPKQRHHHHHHPGNLITLTNVSGSPISNYPFQFGRPFIEGKIPHAPAVFVNGSAVPSQADIKNRYPDGSVEFAVVAVVIPSLPHGVPVTLSFGDTAGSNNTPLSQAAMLDPAYDFDAVMTLTPASGAAQTASARKMLSDGNWRVWTKGPIAQTVMLGDDTPTRSYDIGFGDGYRPFRPRFYATFWPATHQVYVRAVGENGLTTELEDLAYKLSISTGFAAPQSVYARDLTGAVATGTHPVANLIHWSMSSWTREFWLGGAPAQQVNIDENLPYIESTRFLPNLDPSIGTNPSLATDYANYIAGPHDIYDGQWDQGWWSNAMGNGGDNWHLGPYPKWVMWWLHSPDWRARYVALNQADLAAAWPMNLRESDPSRRFQRSDPVGSGTGLGRAISSAGRPYVLKFYDPNATPSSWDNPRQVGPIVGSTTGGNPWTWDDAHQPSAWFPQYVITGDPWYLDEMYNWAAVEVYESAPSPAYVCTTQTGNCSSYRGPTGAYGGLNNASRAVAWTVRGRAETAFAAPDGAPEKSYVTTMLNDAISKWEGGWGITGTPFDGNTEKRWVLSTKVPNNWTNNGGPVAGQVPPLGTLESKCPPASLCNYTPATLLAWGLKDATVNGSYDDPWMNFYLEYGVGRAVELGFAMRPIQMQLGKFPIGIINSSHPWFLGAYIVATEKHSPPGGWYTTWDDVFNISEDPAYLAALNWGSSSPAGGRQTWVQPGLAMLVDAGAPNAAAAWAWWQTYAYGLITPSFRATDPRWAIIPRTDSNVLPPMPTATPP